MGTVVDRYLVSTVISPWWSLQKMKSLAFARLERRPIQRGDHGVGTWALKDTSRRPSLNYGPQGFDVLGCVGVPYWGCVFEKRPEECFPRSVFDWGCIDLLLNLNFRLPLWRLQANTICKTLFLVMLLFTFLFSYLSQPPWLWPSRPGDITLQPQLWNRC